MNILFIAIDTLRADHLGCYGWGRPTSPHLDRLAGRGVVFDEFLAPHIPTHPGYTTMFTGRDVVSHQIVSQGGKLELAPQIPSLPELLSEAGYFTAAADNLGRWFRRGYDVYEGYQWSHDTTGAWRKAEAVTATGLRVLDTCAAQDKPWLCYVHYWEPHTPYLPPAPFDRMFYHDDPTAEHHTSALEMMTNYPAFQYYFAEWMPGTRDVEFPKAQYDAAIAYCDASLATLLDRLGSMPESEDTLIVVTADHGEELDEHQMWFDHHGLYETNLRVPLIMVHPGRLPAGLHLAGLTRHQDLPVTILDLLGLGEGAAAQAMDGASMLPLVDNRSHAGTVDEVFITENAWMKKRGLRTKRWKLIQSLYDELHKRPPLELYDLATDPGEQHNLADELPDLRGELTGRLLAHLERRMAQTGQPDPQSYQDITLTHVGNVKVAVPEEQVLEQDG